MAEIIRLTGASRNTLKLHFRTLVERGHLTKHGQGRGVWYELALATGYYTTRRP
jgi:Fic family protein